MTATPCGGPLVTVIVPSYQHAAFVEDAVRSVWAQTYRPIQLIVIDDCSTDESWTVLQRLAGERPFELLRNDTNAGLNVTIERGLAVAHGEFVSVLASDDQILPQKLERQVAYLCETGKDAVYGNAVLLHADGLRVPVDLGDVAQRFARGRILAHAYCDDTRLPLLQSALFRREVFAELAPLRRQFKSDDWVMLIKLLERFDVGFVDELMFAYRQHRRNSFKNYWRTLPARVEVIANAVPEEYRAEALAKLLSSQAQYLRWDGKRLEALRFLTASIALDPAPARFPAYVARRGRAAAAKLRRLIRKPAAP